MQALLRRALQTRLRLFELEQSSGIRGLSEGERNLLAAIVLCGRPSGATAVSGPPAAGLVAAGVLRQHPLVRRMTHPTYHRMLRDLIDRGMIEYATDSAGRRGYRLGETASASVAGPVKDAEGRKIG